MNTKVIINTAIGSALGAALIALFVQPALAKLQSGDE